MRGCVIIPLPYGSPTPYGHHTATRDVNGIGLWGMTGRPSNAERERKKRDLNRNQLAYVMWAATPVSLREPASKKEFAQVIGVDDVTLWRWEKDPRILDAIRFVVLQNAGDPLHVGQILDMLHNKAIVDKDREAAKVWLQATGVMSQLTRSNSILDHLEDEELSFSDFSKEQLEAMLAEQNGDALEREAIARAKSTLNRTNADVGTID